MRQKATLIALLGLTIASALYATPVGAQEASMRRVEEYTCKDVMRESGANREVAIAFLHGYLLGKSERQIVDVGAFAKETKAFMEQCLDHPNDSAAATMLKIKR